MKVIILAGGLGTRLMEETASRPKPMVEIRGKPMLWHIMNLYACYGHCDFLIACRYKGEVVKEYFRNFLIHNSDLFIRLRDGSCRLANSAPPDWNVGIVDTGLSALTGGRLRHFKHLIGDETFMITYGDGLTDIDIQRLLRFHRTNQKLATVTAVSPVSRFGSLRLNGDCVTKFAEKPRTGEGWINGGFFVFDPRLLTRLPATKHALKANRSSVIGGLGTVACLPPRALLASHGHLAR